MSVAAEDLDRVLDDLSRHEAALVDRLREAVAIQSVSNDPEQYPECLRMARFLKNQLVELGAEVVERSDTAEVPGPGGKPVAVNPILLASFGSDPSKRTVCAYGHYDVMPAAVSEGWKTEPFELTEIADALHGRGASDDKGPLMAWLAAVESYQRAGVALPVNLRLIFEGREEAGSNGLEQVVREECAPGRFLSGVDYFVISDSGFVGSRPSVTYGLRGIVEFEVTVSGPAENLHSGLYGGPVREPMHDLLKLLSSLTDSQQRIVVPGIAETIAPVTEQERALYHGIDFDTQKWMQESSLPGVVGDGSKEDVLMRRWRYPTLTVHGVRQSSDFMATCIPAECSARFSIRAVPDMVAKDVEAAVKAHLDAEFSALQTCNTLKILLDHGGDWFLGDVNDPNYTAARLANKRVHGAEPDLIREGGSIPIAIAIAEISQKSVCLLPICGATDNIHGPNEKMETRNLFTGARVMAAYLAEIAV